MERVPLETSESTEASETTETSESTEGSENKEGKESSETGTEHSETTENSETTESSEDSENRENTEDAESVNLVEETDGCSILGFSNGNLFGADPVLSPLQNNGGHTFTHALLVGSPAINGGDPGGCHDHQNALLPTDQRGFRRNGICDMGAFEYDSPGP